VIEVTQEKAVQNSASFHLEQLDWRQESEKPLGVKYGTDDHAPPKASTQAHMRTDHWVACQAAH